MKNPELYNKTVGILVKAYFEGVLVNGDCAACAVGNIVCANMGYNMVKLNDEITWMHNDHSFRPNWGKVFGTNTTNYLFGLIRRVKQVTTLYRYNSSVMKEVESTGYSLQELANIEYAFEYGYKGRGDKMFNALMSVIDTLDTIHQNTDTQLSKQIKHKFNPSSFVNG